METYSPALLMLTVHTVMVDALAFFGIIMSFTAMNGFHATCVYRDLTQIIVAETALVLAQLASIDQIATHASRVQQEITAQVICKP